MSELVKFAKTELRAAGLFDTDADFGGEIAPCVVAMMETFTAYGHSGGSAERTLDLFTRLAKHKPLTPLTGEDDEWEDMEAYNPGTPIWMNKRCSKVFKDNDRAWIVTDFADPSRPGDGKVEYITFPYSVK